MLLQFTCAAATVAVATLVFAVSHAMVMIGAAAHVNESFYEHFCNFESSEQHLVPYLTGAIDGQGEAWIALI